MQAARAAGAHTTETTHATFMANDQLRQTRTGCPSSSASPGLSAKILSSALPIPTAEPSPCEHAQRHPRRKAHRFM